MTTAPQVPVSASTAEGVRALRQAHRWTVASAARRAKVSPTVWTDFEAGQAVRADDYRAILSVLGFTAHTMAFVERAGGTRR